MPIAKSPLKAIEPALDRFREAHFWIHGLEHYYHDADPFRWHLNAFLKALKEVPLLLQSGLQNRRGFSSWFAPERANLNGHLLINALGNKRDLVVHRGMLVPNSHGSIGITEGRGMKLGIGFPLHPLEGSDAGMQRYLHFVSTDPKNDVLGLLIPDDDSMPCVQRVWKLEGFDDELVNLVGTAWLRLGETVNSVVQWAGHEPRQLDLDCRHSSQQLQFKTYDRDALRQILAQLKS